MKIKAQTYIILLIVFILILFLGSCAPINKGYISKKIYNPSYIVYVKQFDIISKQWVEKTLFQDETYYFKIKSSDNKRTKHILVSKEEYLLYDTFDYYIITKEEKERLLRKIRYKYVK